MEFIKDTKNVTNDKRSKVIKVKKEFRLATKRFSLTYSQCPLSLEEAVDQLKRKFEMKSYKLINYAASLEDHKLVDPLGGSSGKHIHAYLEFDKRVDIKTADSLHLFYDIGSDLEPTIIKGNYQSCRTTQSWLDYILKDVEDTNDSSRFLCSKDLRLLLSSSGSLLSVDKAMLERAERGDIKGALSILRELDTRRYITSWKSVERSLRGIALKARGFTTKFNMVDFNIPSHLNINEVISRTVEEKKTFMLVGASGTGKTQYILSYIKEILALNPLVVNNLDGLRFFDDSIHEAIVFDDVDFSSCQFDRERLIKILDCECSVTISIKHSSVSIPENIPRFIISNLSLEHYVGIDMVTRKEINRRYSVIDIKGVILFMSFN